LIKQEEIVAPDVRYIGISIPINIGGYVSYLGIVKLNFQTGVYPAVYVDLETFSKLL